MTATATKENRGGARKGAGRKSNAEKGLEARETRITIKLTPTELAALEALAGDEDVSVWARGVLFAVAK